MAMYRCAGLRLTTFLHPRVIAPKRHAIRAMAAAAPDTDFHVLEYKYVADILEKRGPYREKHLEGAHKMAADNKLVLAGALADPVDGALFIFRNVTKEEIEAFVKADPYVRNGLVPNYTIRPYIVVAGDSRGE